MIKFSKKTLQRLKSHLEKLNNSTNEYKQNSRELRDKKFYLSKLHLKNNNVAKALLIESVFLNLEILNFTRSSVLVRLLLKNKRTFTNKELNNNSYLFIKLPISQDIKRIRLEKTIKFLIKNFNQRILYAKNDIKNFKVLTHDKLNKYYKKINFSINRWYLYLYRFFILSLIHFIPFIQLSTKLFYTYPNPLIANPTTSSFFHIFPLLMGLLGVVGPIINNESLSFLMIGFYYKIFIISYKKYGISRKIAFQGTFAIALMLLNYCVVMSSEITTLLYKFAKRFFFFRKSQAIDLLKDDINFFIDDLEELRYYKETFLHWGESIFSVNELAKTIKINESFTIISLLGVIALLYNCVYFILRGEKPIIPVITKTVRRMMVDRNSDEF